VSTTGKSGRTGAKTAKADREERLAQALRANLRRRKAARRPDRTGKARDVS